ncbi:lipocalin family protein [Galbibacter sp. BG1]|uniref:lipocalin family protein n=1 Tax=Galbibacter sp. BG1 TaxID=1170699 RepID=UPI0015BAAF04|nr:lipocalin family protein [Galbibacter sp. BG1]QLE02488.1 lipocalin family protein [Galbibacter sp. BG1]
MRNSCFIFVLFIIIGCSNNDDEIVDYAGNAILGDWILDSEYTFDPDFPESPIPALMDGCEGKLTYSFQSDGTFNVEYFERDEQNCISRGVNSGEWTVVSDSVYTFKPSFKINQTGVLSGKYYALFSEDLQAMALMNVNNSTKEIVYFKE